MTPAGQFPLFTLPADDAPVVAAGNDSTRPTYGPPPAQWTAVLDEVERQIRHKGLSPARVLVLVPYAQLMDVGRRAWANRHPGGFAPRFETSRNLALALQPFVAGATDLCMDMARDTLVAAALLDKLVPGRIEPALRSLLVSRIVEAAVQIAPVAAAVPPGQRPAWAAELQAPLHLAPSALQWESVVASVALAWVGNSAFPTDAWWSSAAAPGAVADVLLIATGFHEDPMACALCDHWGVRAVRVPLAAIESVAPDGSLACLHRCESGEDEAQRAAACVIARINEGHVPVALVANDRVLVRRVSALLSRIGARVRDETGWKLSTTHAASQFMALLRAANPRALTDDVLDWMKHLPLCGGAQLQVIERAARDAGVARWQAALQRPELAAAVPATLPPVLVALHEPRPLVNWLGDVAGALEACGLWRTLTEDPAGQQLVQVLRLGSAAAAELSAVADGLAETEGAGTRRRAGSHGRMTLAAFSEWVREVLEGASFTPKAESHPQVVVVPMAQLLGRGFAAAVVPGCDERHLPASPEPSGHWTTAQREVLGLPSRQALAESARRAWQAALALPQLDILWRTQEGGETVLPSPWVEALLPREMGTDPRVTRSVALQATQRPAPMAVDLLPDTLSASAYQDLRHCPYRFYALRQLRLSEVPELEETPDQRDLGNWLHAILRTFHEQRGDGRPGLEADRLALDRLAIETADAMGLRSGEGGAGFLPFEAVWPGLREGYLTWLAGYEAGDGRAGPRFEQAEAAFDARLGHWTLYGKLDRVDVQASPEGPVPLVIDYKTESRARTLERVKEPLEDTQLAFYAALLPQETLRAGYLSITDRGGSGPREAATLWVEQESVLMAREQLREGFVQDLTRVAQGQPMRPLGEGSVCDFCAARGLCRKDFLETA